MMATPAVPVIGRPARFRVLGVLTGPTADAIVEGDQRGLGAIEELFELPGSEAEVHVIKYPRLEDLSTQLQGWKPNFVYVYGGVAGDKRDLEKQSVSHLSFLVDQQGRFVEAALHLFLASFGGLHLDTVYFDAQGCTQIGEALHAAGVPNVVVWPRDSAPPCLPAMHFAHSFFCMLRNRSVTVPEAFALASHMAKAHCSLPPASGTGPLSEPVLPRLLSKAPTGLPSMASVPPLILGGKDVSTAIAAAVPGYDQVRLLAPIAELRMLVSGLSGFINPQSLAYMGEALRAFLTTEARRASVQKLVPCERTPEHLPPGSSALRCELLSFSGVPLTVVLGGPVDLLQNSAVVEHALRQTMVADAHSLQFKLPPPNVPLPACRTNPAVASGAPLVEVLVVTSVWCIQLLKLLCQDGRHRALVALGIGAISSSPVASFTRADANRYTTVVTGNDPTRLLQAQAPNSPLEGGTAAVANGAAAVAVPTPSSLAVGPASATEGSEAPAAAGVSSVPAHGWGQGAAAAGPAAAVAQAAPALPPQPPPGAPRLGAVAAGGSGAAPEAAVPGAQPGLAGGVHGSSSFAAAQPSALGASAALGGGGSSALGSQQLQSGDRGHSESPEHTSANAISNPMRISQHMQVAPWRSSRPPIKQCSEEQFMSDLIAFLTDRQGRQIDPKAFPEAILNGSRLDLYNLYREVCNRGGYGVGNGINWKGQVFPRMRNYTAQHKMTGVGNALKRHYQMFLLEYEHSHPGDVSGGQCSLCGHGEDVGTDWVSCDMCDSWVHFSCDKRPFLGNFKDYSRGRTRSYCCPRCYEIKRQRSMQQQQLEEEAAASGQPAALVPQPSGGAPANGAAAGLTGEPAAAEAGAVPMEGVKQEEGVDTGDQGVMAAAPHHHHQQQPAAAPLPVVLSQPAAAPSAAAAPAAQQQQQQQQQAPAGERLPLPLGQASALAGLGQPPGMPVTAALPFAQALGSLPMSQLLGLPPGSLPLPGLQALQPGHAASQLLGMSMLQLQAPPGQPQFATGLGVLPGAPLTLAAQQQQQQQQVGVISDPPDGNGVEAMQQ